MRLELDFRVFYRQRAAIVKLLVGGPGLRFEDEKTARGQLSRYFEEESLYTSVAKVQVDPLDCRQAENYIELFPYHGLLRNLLYVIFTSKLQSASEFLGIDFLDWVINRNSSLHSGASILQILSLA